METLANLALIGLPVAGGVTLGVIWLTRSVFKDVSLSGEQQGDPSVVAAEKRAEALAFQLSVAEDLGIDAVTLNALKDEADLAGENAERARQTQEDRQEAPVTVPVPWFSPVAALHSATGLQNESGK